jgi:GWxTD domain-containing protein
MKKLTLIALATIIGFNTFSRELEAYFLYACFNSPEQSYIETYISAIGQSATFVKNTNGNFQAEIEITMLFKQNDQVVTFRKYTLESPEIKDTLNNLPNFIDQQRIPLENGIYNFEMYIKDKNTDKKGFVFVDIIQVDFNKNQTTFSGIQFLEDYKETKEESVLSKNGYDLIPYISDYFPENMDRLIFYTELYNTNISFTEDFLIKYYVERFEDGKVIEQCSRFKKVSPSQVNVLLAEFNINELYSGNYNLVIEVRNRNNDLISSKKHFFQRSKPMPYSEDNNYDDFAMNTMFNGNFENIDSIREYVSCLWPIANSNERNFINYQLKKAEPEQAKQFFYDFWLKRYSAEAGNEWRIYKAQVDFVNKGYKTPIQKGYETDRGRIYLQYGTPNDIYVSKHEPSAYPYEIWHYYEIEDQRDRKFVFYNPSLVGESYELLHSDVIGELKTPNWERYLSKRNNTLYNFDIMNSDDQWGSRAREEFDKH